MTSIRGRTLMLAAGVLAAAGWYLASRPVALAAILSAMALAATARWASRHRRTVRQRREIQTLGGLLALTPPEFEAAVADLLARDRYRSVELHGGSGDLGADILCLDRWGRRVVVQCKRNAPGIPVGSGAIQRFIGTIAHLRYDRGIFVTTARFTGPAAELATAHAIELIDGAMLSRIAARLNA